MRLKRTHLITAAMLAALGAALASQTPAYDIVIRNGRVLDGTGNPFVYADVAIAGDTIAAVGNLQRAGAARTIDARGQYVTPGFIALHEHIEGDVVAGRGALPNFTTQGFTTADLFAQVESKDGSWWEQFEWREARAYHKATRDYPFLQMSEPGAFADFVQTLTATRASLVSLKERDRVPLQSGRVRLLLEILTVQNSEGRVSTWRIDAAPPGGDTAPWNWP